MAAGSVHAAIAPLNAGPLPCSRFASQPLVQGLAFGVNLLASLLLVPISCLAGPIARPGPGGGLPGPAGGRLDV